MAQPHKPSDFFHQRLRRLESFDLNSTEEGKNYGARGLTYREKGFKEQAITDFETYLRLVPNASNRAQFEQWIRELKGQ